MSTVTRPRGPLPARVYWIRRLSVVAVALLLVFGVARIFGTASDGADSGDQAAQAGAEKTESSSTDDSESGAAEENPSESASSDSTGAASEWCQTDDVLVKPDVGKAVAGQDVKIALELRTKTASACKLRVSPRTLAVQVTSGTDPIWSTQQCRRAITPQVLTVRSSESARYRLTWPEGKRSDETCSRYATWAMPGWYHVEAAVLGSDPADVQFELAAPERPIVTATPTPTPDQQPDQRSERRGGGSGEQLQPTPTPRATPQPELPQPSGRPAPSGAVEPNG